MNIIFLVLSAAIIGTAAALLVLPFRKKRLSVFRIAAIITGLCVVYHAIAFTVMVTGGTPLKVLNGILVWSILPAWGLGAPSGNMSWTVLVSFTLQTAVASVIGIGMYILGMKERYREPSSPGDAEASAPEK